LAARAGISGATVLVKDQSSTSNLPNAQVRGILATKRIVIFDTMLGQTDERELLVVVAHEMGHYAHADLWKDMAIQDAFICLGLLAANGIGGAALRRFGTRWGFSSLSSVASLPLLYLSFNLVVLATTPAVNAFIRSWVSGLRLTSTSARCAPGGFLSASTNFNFSIQRASGKLRTPLG
jgi:Zn-dependent protease with chaperone function